MKKETSIKKIIESIAEYYKEKAVGVDNDGICITGPIVYATKEWIDPFITYHNNLLLFKCGNLDIFKEAVRELCGKKGSNLELRYDGTIDGRYRAEVATSNNSHTVIISAIAFSKDNNMAKQEFSSTFSGIEISSTDREDALLDFIQAYEEMTVTGNGRLASSASLTLIREMLQAKFNIVTGWNWEESVAQGSFIMKQIDRYTEEIFEWLGTLENYCN